MAEEITILLTAAFMSLIDFKKIVNEFRTVFKLGLTEEFPAVKIAERDIPESDSKFTTRIIADCEWDFKDSVQAYYRHSENVHEIGIKESVYRRALDGDKDALFSVAHEIVHWGLVNHIKLRFGLNKDVPHEVNVVLCGVHENFVDLITPLLVLSEEELKAAQGARPELDYTCLSGGQLDLALFYYQNYDVLQENFKKNIEPYLKKAAQEGGVENGEKKGLA